MPRIGQVGEKVPAGVPPKRREFAEALTGVYNLLEGSMKQAAIAARIGKRPSTLSRYLNGGMVPADPVTVEHLYWLAADFQEGHGKAMPVALEQLLKLRVEAEFWTPVRWKREAAARAARAATATLRRSVSRPPNAPSGARVGVPVPPAKGDRHPNADTQAAWAGAADVARLLESRHVHDALVLLGEAGSTLPPDGICSATADLRDRGLHDAADAVLLSAARRSEKEVLHIARKLTAADRHPDVKVLFGAGSDAAGSAT